MYMATSSGSATASTAAFLRRIAMRTSSSGGSMSASAGIEPRIARRGERDLESSGGVSRADERHAAGEAAIDHRAERVRAETRDRHPVDLIQWNVSTRPPG